MLNWYNGSLVGKQKFISAKNKVVVVLYCGVRYIIDTLVCLLSV